MTRFHLILLKNTKLNRTEIIFFCSTSYYDLVFVVDVDDSRLRNDVDTKPEISDISNRIRESAMLAVSGKTQFYLDDSILIYLATYLLKITFLNAG